MIDCHAHAFPDPLTSRSSRGRSVLGKVSPLLKRAAARMPTARVDIEGAARLGFRTIWIERNVPWPDDLPVCADHVVPTLEAAMM